MSPPTPYVVSAMGLQAYQPVYQQMLDFTAQRDEHSSDQIWWLEHQPVFTLGRNSKPEHLLAIKNIPIVPTDRGGQVTYHGPGQLIIYPLLDIKRAGIGVKALVNAIEQSVINVLAMHAVKAERLEGAPGVYVDNKKIASLGLKVSRGYCYHGLSLNVDMDIAPFSQINPCGLVGMQITQCREQGVTAKLPDLANDLVAEIVQQVYR